MSKTRPLGRKAYGSIGHLPTSRLGPGDHRVSEGQARICTERARDRHDRVIVQEKLDGSCVAVAKIDGRLVALQRSGYEARTSPYEQHHHWAAYVDQEQARFGAALLNGEWLVGEWLGQAVGTHYKLGGREPFVPFDLMYGEAVRTTFAELVERLGGMFPMPTVLNDGRSPMSVDAAMAAHGRRHYGCEQPEGVVYRVERESRVNYLAKHVRNDKIDGKHLPSVSGKPAVWQWLPNSPTEA